MRELSERVADVPPGGDSAKVRAGQVGEHAQYFSDDTTAALDAVWAKDITPQTGFADYAAMIKTLE